MGCLLLTHSSQFTLSRSLDFNHIPYHLLFKPKILVCKSILMLQLPIPLLTFLLNSFRYDRCQMNTKRLKKEQLQRCILYSHTCTCTISPFSQTSQTINKGTCTGALLCQYTYRESALHWPSCPCLLGVHPCWTHSSSWTFEFQASVPTASWCWLTKPNVNLVTTGLLYFCPT